MSKPKDPLVQQLEALLIFQRQQDARDAARNARQQVVVGSNSVEANKDAVLLLYAMIHEARVLDDIRNEYRRLMHNVDRIIATYE